LRCIVFAGLKPGASTETTPIENPFLLEIGCIR